MKRKNIIVLHLKTGDEIIVTYNACTLAIVIVEFISKFEKYYRKKSSIKIMMEETR